jgi:peptide/nickel transport system substrate-binding protein
MYRHNRKLRLAGIAAIAALATIAAGCASSSSTTPPTGVRLKGGVATWAEPPGAQPNWIWPFMPITNYSVYNSQSFQWLMYRPLYMFGNNGVQTTVNYPLSLANAPVYSGTTVTITMKGWKWSNGETIDAKDVIFWLNMESAEKTSYAGYAPGTMPDNVVSYKATAPDTVTLTLNKPYSSFWYTYNQLAEITPMPMAWDVTSLGAGPGSGGCTTDSAKDHWAHCKAVFTFLTAQTKDTGTYATSPIWSVVDGPWKLSGFTTSGNDTMVPNKAYSGSPKPTISELKMVPYTSDATEYTALKTAALDVGYIPSADLPIKVGTAVVPTGSANPLGSAYNLQPYYAYGIFYWQPNFNNPTFGAVFKQLYIRQALQEAVDQPGIDKAIYRGYAYPTSGPVPTQPPNQWIPTVQAANGGQGPYAFNVAAAMAVLTSHGWSEVGGVMTCQVPAKCGPGIKKGTQLKFTLFYSTGTAAFTDEVAVYKSDASKAGIAINTVGQTFNTVIGESTPCKPGPKCTWDGLMYGGWLFNGPGFEPTGEPLFQTGAGSNSGSYSNPAEDSLITQTHTSSSLAIFHQYAAYTAQQLPYIWMPNAYTVEAVTGKLHGVTFNPFGNLLPEYWYFTK